MISPVNVKGSRLHAAAWLLAVGLSAYTGSILARQEPQPLGMLRGTGLEIFDEQRRLIADIQGEDDHQAMCFCAYEKGKPREPRLISHFGLSLGGTGQGSWGLREGHNKDWNGLLCKMVGDPLAPMLSMVDRFGVQRWSVSIPEGSEGDVISCDSMIKCSLRTRWAASSVSWT
ncbi:MAG: hypothetical protein ACI8QC_002906 [Planctomycetota bacterium]|jgi:hypothetical protein